MENLLSKFTSRRFLLTVIGIIFLLAYSAMYELESTRVVELGTIILLFGIGSIGIEDWLRQLNSKVDVDAVFDKFAKQINQPMLTVVSDSVDFNHVIEQLINEYGDDLETIIADHRVKDVMPASETLIATDTDSVTTVTSNAEKNSNDTGSGKHGEPVG